MLSGMYPSILLVTEDGLIEFANQAFCDYFDLEESPGDLVGLTSPEMIEKISRYLSSSRLWKSPESGI